MDEHANKHVWISTDEELAKYCQQWLNEPIVGLDTEFQRTDTFYPIAGLIQIAVKTDCYLIDPLSITDFSPFVELLQAPNVLKILHACSEDLELFTHCYGAVPSPLFDTQIACAFIGLGLSIGYQRLLKQEFDVELEKEQTRSDWLQRPLTEAQKHYAALDVVYLTDLYFWIETQLKAGNKYDWVMEECQRLADSYSLEENFQLSYLQRFKQGWKLKPKQLSVLQALSAWREEQARERDMPRNFLLHNSSIMAMAQRAPRNMKDLSNVERMRGRFLQTDGKTLLVIIDEAANRALEDCPAPPPRPLPADMAKQVKQLKAKVSQTAEELDVAPELLVRKKDLEQLVRNAQQERWELPQDMQGWRETVISKPLLEILQQQD